MRIAMSAFGPNLMSRLSPRLGGCSYFLVIDPGTKNLEVYENKHDGRGGGTGAQAARFLASKKVNALITGRCRADTFKILSDAGIYVFLKQSGIVKEVLEKYARGLLRRATGPTIHAEG
jgi:predicted Fe-Mo cluster-binding NifX family protein